MKYKLTYFNLAARGETARLLLKLGGQDFEDNRVEMKDWPAIKPNTPYGQLPLLEVGGLTICQSVAINRYLAKKFGYYGDTDEIQAQVDMMVDCVMDPTHQLGIVWTAKDEDKQSAGKKFNTEFVVPAFSKLEALYKKKGGKGWLVGDKLSLADLTLTTMGNVCEHFSMGEPLWSKFPLLHAIKKNVEAEPRIAEWIKTRPQTPF